MSTPSTTDNPGLKATSSPTFAHTFASLNYTVRHVFLPVQFPSENDYALENDLSLARSVCAAAHAYRAHVRGTSEQAQWHRITGMLDNLQVSIQSEQPDNGHVIAQLREMRSGGTLTGSIWIPTDSL